MTTFVTSFFLLNNLHSNRSTEFYFNHFKTLVDTGINLVLYITPSLLSEVTTLIGNNKNVVVIPKQLEDTWVYKTVKNNDVEMIENRNKDKDTLDYMITQNTKLECVYHAISINPYGTDSFAWIDFGIFHVIRNPLGSAEMLKKIAKSNVKSLVFPGCWPPGYDWLHAINWRFCGGFFIGSRIDLVNMWITFMNFLTSFLKQHKKMLWEVNLWAGMEQAGLAIEMYIADHNDTILHVPDRYLLT